MIFFKFSIPKCYNTPINIISVNNTTFIYNGIYVRATCFDLVGHPQALQEKQIQELFSFSELWDPKFLQVCTCKHLGSQAQTCKHFGSQNAEKLNNYWICFSWRT